VFLDFLFGILRGTRKVLLKEARSIANTMRKYYSQLFVSSPGKNNKIYSVLTFVTSVRKIIV
jgi:hypothetical protein